MIDEPSISVWIDDPSAVFRLGLAALLEPPGFRLSGESARFVPAPDLAVTDVLVFDLGAEVLTTALRLTSDHPTRSVAIARSPEDPLLAEAVEGGVSGALIRTALTREAFHHCLRSVAGGNGFLPSAVLARLAGGRSASRRGRAADELTGRELDVLRLLSKGESTREIARTLSYSEKTVKNIVHDLLVRMSCRNRAQVVALATRRGLI